jgi:hypothetical protein
LSTFRQSLDLSNVKRRDLLQQLLPLPRIQLVPELQQMLLTAGGQVLFPFIPTKLAGVASTRIVHCSPPSKSPALHPGIA